MTEEMDALRGALESDAPGASPRRRGARGGGAERRTRGGDGGDARDVVAESPRYARLASERARRRRVSITCVRAFALRNR